MPTNYALALNGIIVGSSNIIKKLHLERNDVFTMIYGIQAIRSTNENDFNLPSSNRSSTRLSITSTDSLNSSILSQTVFQELDVMRQQINELMNNHSINRSEDTTLSDSISSETSGDPSSQSSQSYKLKQDLTLLKKKVNANELSTQQTFDNVNSNLSELDNEIKLLKQTMNNLTRTAFSGSAKNELAGQSFSTLQLEQVESRIDALQHAIGIEGLKLEIPIVSQLSSLTTRIQSIQKDLGNLKYATEDLDEKIDKVCNTSSFNQDNQHPSLDHEEEIIDMVNEVRRDISQTKKDLESSINLREEGILRRINEIESKVDSKSRSVSSPRAGDNAVLNNRVNQIELSVKSLEQRINSIDNKRESDCKECIEKSLANKELIQDLMKQIEELKTLKNTLDTTVNSLKEIESICTDNEEDIDDCNKRIDELVKVGESAINMAIACKERIDSLNESTKDEDNISTEELASQCHLLTTRISQIDKVCSTTASKTEEMMNEMKKLQIDDNLNRMKKDIAEMKERVEEGKKIAEEGKSMNNDTQLLTQELKNHIDEMKLTIEEVKSTAEDALTMASDVTSSMTTVITATEEVAKSTEEIDSHIQSITSTIEEMQSVSSNVQTSINQLNEQYNHVDERMIQVETTTGKNTTSCNETVQSLQSITERITTMEGDIQSIKKRHADAIASLTSANTSSTVLSSEVKNDIDEVRVIAENAISQIKEKEKELKNEMSEMSKQVKSEMSNQMKSDISEATNQIKSEMSNQLKNEMNEMSNQMKSEMNEMSNQVKSEMSNQVKSEMNEMSKQMKSEMNEVTNQMNSLNETTVNEARKQALEGKETVLQLQCQVNDMKTTIENTRQKVDTLATSTTESLKKNENQTKQVQQELKEMKESVLSIQTTLKEDEKELTITKNSVEDLKNNMEHVSSVSENALALIQQYNEEVKKTTETTSTTMKGHSKENLVIDQQLLTSMKQSIEQLEEEQKKITSRDSSQSISNDFITEMKLKLSILESKVQSLLKITENQADLVADVKCLKENSSATQESMNAIEIKQGAISTQMSTLHEDWEGRQQALLKEFTLIKTEFDRLLMPLNDGSSKSHSFFKKKEVEAVAMSLDVLREDEKGLKERVVANSEVCSDRFVRLSQRLETVKMMIEQLEIKRVEDTDKANARMDEKIRVLNDDIQQLRNLYNDQFIGNVMSIKRKEN